MALLLRLARLIDGLNELAGRLVMWLVLAATLVSAANALVRYGLKTSSNAWLELQWYFFGALFLLAAGYTLKHNGHVRIDIIYGRLSARTRAMIDLFGTLVFLLPICGLMTWLGWPMFTDSFMSGEMSSDAGGLIRWPIKLMIPLGFALLFLQGIAEVIKRLGVLTGHLELPPEKPVEEV
jgi:TRAP-type mannitol/chloroaromatic compound transport system permease small subunit